MNPADWLHFAWQIAWLPGCVLAAWVMSLTPTAHTFAARWIETHDDNR